MIGQLRMIARLAGSRFGAAALFCAAGLAVSLGWRQVQTTRPAEIAGEGRVIDEVRFEGNRTSDSAYLQTIVRIAPGTTWKRDEIAAACARLRYTGKFECSPFAELR